jgi:hypothetical protein
MRMHTEHPGVTGRAPGDVLPLAVTVRRACELTGLGQTTIWGLLAENRLEAVDVPGVRRKLISYRSLVRLLLPPEPEATPPRRKRGRPRKPAPEAVTAT